MKLRRFKWWRVSNNLTLSKKSPAATQSASRIPRSTCSASTTLKQQFSCSQQSIHATANAKQSNCQNYITVYCWHVHTIPENPRRKRTTTRDAWSGLTGRRRSSSGVATLLAMIRHDGKPACALRPVRGLLLCEDRNLPLLRVHSLCHVADTEGFSVKHRHTHTWGIRRKTMWATRKWLYRNIVRFIKLKLQQIWGVKPGLCSI